ncbi:DNA cytosine methyltransferase [Bacillus thuringiensis]|uniref:Cytosine-specific methyltransferase n=1 Tax=Bacillus thuringiensis HD-771 TaxID=1218175 RepID=A0A9W3JAW1_BACTU|nr:DNA cytosine methyltransferase [Bacillus thuringiensis]AFQ14633.1 DNA-cytosine methyltransferase [Bacillus thuringiensis HD-771]MEC3268946.1 DNA cytosine methyltransferase [Bacillus thuringiensis]MEC3515436.1 DNA cytosine methyltransferase [Bacillus thuringiensis]MED2072293.1 DNA cytosine methyltransferase [Bacillus thuringiensis]MED2223628.1 DNA cytosine methyltransferase [Bacillus thuringiensis]
MTETIKKIKLFEAFAGIGTQAMALKRVAKELGFEVEPVGICEIDKFAIKSHQAIHGEIKNFGDISKVDPKELPDMDLFTYSFPCQDLSISGKQKGLVGGTRSGLLYECEKVITAKRPKYLLLENVKNLVGKKFKPDFDKWIEWLESQGYRNYWKVLNAKDYGVPQNRERVFVVSILGEGAYGFPEKFPLELKLKDILEDEVEEKYFLSTKLLEGFTAHKKRHQEKGTGFQYIPRDVNKHASCLRANAALAPTDNTVVVETSSEKVLEKQREFPELILAGKLSMKGHDQINRVYDSEGVSPALTTMQGGHRHPKIIDYVDGEIRVKEATKLGYKVAEEGDSINIEHPNSTTRPRRVGKQVAQTLTTSPQQVTIKDYRIRRLTPLECWRLMGISDEAFSKAKAAEISDSQLYKQAGNAIVVDVLEAIFRNLFK